MNFNSIIFPSPRPSYSSESLFGNIIYIPKCQQFSISEIQAYRSNSMLSKPVVTSPSNSQKAKHFVFNNDKSSKTIKTQNSNAGYIPCLFLPYSRGSTKILMYFHGNAEDAGGALRLLDTIKNRLKVHVLAMEYPGYGIYKGNPNAEAILEDGELVFNFLTKILSIPSSDLIIFGRSIGSGPATYMAAKHKVFALILMSPYTSISAVARHLVGRLGEMLVADRFRNVDYIKQVKSPVFIVHGQKDPLIPFTQAQELCEQCTTAMIL